MKVEPEFTIGDNVRIKMYINGQYHWVGNVVVNVTKEAGGFYYDLLHNGRFNINGSSFTIRSPVFLCSFYGSISEDAHKLPLGIHKGADLMGVAIPAFR